MMPRVPRKSRGAGGNKKVAGKPRRGVAKVGKPAKVQKSAKSGGAVSRGGAKLAAGRTVNRKSAGVRVSRVGRELRGGLKGDGLVAALVVVEQVGKDKDELVGTWRGCVSVGRSGFGRPGGGGARVAARTCEALAAVGNMARVRLLTKMLEGPATYRSLQGVSKLKAGPLYHHINQLRLAGLVLPKQRDLYELTRGGRNLILAAFVLGSAVADKRRRPQG